MKKRTLLPTLLALFGIAVLTFTWAGPWSPFSASRGAARRTSLATPAMAEPPPASPVERRRGGSSGVASPAPQILHSNTQAPPDSEETPKTIPLRETGRLRILNEQLGIPLDELEKKSADEIRKLFEDNACRLGMSIAHLDPESGEMVTIINKPTCEALGTPWPTPPVGTP